MDARCPGPDQHILSKFVAESFAFPACRPNLVPFAAQTGFV
jgi:hypothetical protein